MDKNDDEWAEVVPDLPLPVFYVGGRYLLFDLKAAAWIRREHNICGYNIGTLPQAPSQNIFLGVPIMIMPEEAQILVDRGVGYVVDDARAHDQAIYDRDAAGEEAYLDETRRHAWEVWQQRAREQAEAKERALSKQNAKAKAKAKPQEGPSPDPSTVKSSATTTTTTTTSISQPQYHVTPTSSHHLLHTTRPAKPTAANNLSSSSSASPVLPKGKPLPGLPASFPLFRHLHSRGFFMTPGLRFGCQYSTYPGDPLRYHSHFLSVGVEWDQELDLMDLVGGGRLGTGVKKGFLIGGVEPSSSSSLDEVDDDNSQSTSTETTNTPRVRTFTIEWAVM